MKTFSELLQSIKTDIQATINADSSKEQIDKTNDICSNLDELAKTHEGTVTELHDIKDAYIKSIRQSGSSEKPKDETEPPQPRSLESIVADLQKKNC